MRGHLVVLLYLTNQYFFVLLDFPALDHLIPSASAEIQAQAVKELIKRTVPKHVGSFAVKIDPTIGPKNKDTFKVSNFKQYKNAEMS